MVIFDCNGVLVDSEPIATAVLSRALASVGIKAPPQALARRFSGRRPSDIFYAIEQTTGRRLPKDFGDKVAAEVLRRLRTELRPIPYVTRALTWIRGPKAVASSSPFDRIKLSLEVTDLIGFFCGRLFSASRVKRGKPAPDLFLLAAQQMQVPPSQCIVVEDSVPGITAAAAAGMTPIAFVGGSEAAGHLAGELSNAGARAIVADMRHLHGTITSLRGW
ncbi:MAG: HAD family hydrolase [Xanthobacteraceae bacterium]